jgi:hypothetical protein
MTANPPTMSNAELTTFKSIEYVPRLKNKTLLDTIILQHGGITFHVGMTNPISQFFTIITDGVQGVSVMITYPNRFVLMTIIGYPVSMNNNKILVVQVENGSLYNKVHTKPIETLEGNHFNGFKVIPINFGVKKSIVVEFHAKVPVNLTSITHFHNIVTTRSKR